MIATAMATVTVMTTAMAGNHCSHNHYKCDNKQVNKGPPERDDKAFKPCHLHGPKSQHIFKKCFKNPRIRTRSPMTKIVHTKRTATMSAMEAKARVTCKRGFTGPKQQSRITLRGQTTQQGRAIPCSFWKRKWRWVLMCLSRKKTLNQLINLKEFNRKIIFILHILNNYVKV